MKTELEVYIESKLIPCCGNCQKWTTQRDVSGIVLMVCDGIMKNVFERCERWRGK